MPLTMIINPSHQYFSVFSSRHVTLRLSTILIEGAGICAKMHRAECSWLHRANGRPLTLPEIVREALATVCAPLVVSLPWCVTTRCPIVDPDLAPGRSAIPVLVAAMVLSARVGLQRVVEGELVFRETELFAARVRLA